MFLDRIASPDFSDLSIEERLERDAKVAAYFAQQRVARAALLQEQTVPEMQHVRTIDMSLPPNGRPAFAEESV
jgi:hypothetical protein